MKKIYKTDIGTLIYVGLGMLFFLGGTFLAFFIINDTPIWVKIISPIISIFGIFYFINLLKYDLEIDEKEISSKVILLSFIPKRKTVKFAEIDEIMNSTSIFEEGTLIFIKSHDKILQIPVGFGLPWSVLGDILPRLPKDTKINFEPFIWKHINKPDNPDTFKRVIITAVILIFLILSVFFYFWWKAFK